MRVLVEKLEEYRKNEGSVKEALRSAQKTCDSMVREAEAKCISMLHNAEAKSGGKAAPVSLEGIEAVEAKLREAQEKLAELKAGIPEEAPPAPEVAKEIAESLEKLVGTTEDIAPVAPRPARSDSGTNRFTNLQFGKNYDPTKR